MRSPFRTYVQYREERLAAEEDPLKEVEPFQWGLESLGLDRASPRPLDALLGYVEHQTARSGDYYQPAPLTSWSLEGEALRFPSPLESGVPENDVVVGRLFEDGSRDRAVLLLPYWNANGPDLDLVGRLLLRCGLPTLRLSLPYHDSRRPPGMTYAREIVSANIGRTLSANRQAVLDARRALDWLQARGYRRLGLLGMSLGSSVGTVVASHDLRVGAAAFACSAALFGEAVWTGRATRHIRRAVEPFLTLEQINALWSLISPGTFVPRLEGHPVQHLVITGAHDNVFMPHLTEALIGRYRRHEVRCTWLRLPCGHYTLGTFPFNVAVLAQVVRFFRRSLES